MTTLPEALLLLATDDSKGTIFPSAFLALDHGLRGAALAELRLAGALQTHGGQIRRTGTPPSTGSATVDQVSARTLGLPSPAPIADWLSELAAVMPAIREFVAEELEARGVLDEKEVTSAILPEAVIHPLRAPAIEDAVRAALDRGLEAGDAIDARTGTLLALCDACNLLPRVFPAERREAAHALAAFVASKDSIVAAVRAAIHQAEGGE